MGKIKGGPIYSREVRGMQTYTQYTLCTRVYIIQ